jgi:DNA-binding NtrC family response regulator
MDSLTEYSWPGNVRELENAVERAVVLCPGSLIEVDELPQVLRTGQRRRPSPEEVPEEGLDFRKAVAEYQSRLIRSALRHASGVQRQAARLLNLSPTTLNEMVHRLGLGNEQEDGHLK